MAGGVRSLPRPRLPALPSWRKLRRRLIIVGLAAVALAAGYQFWLRDSGFVAVENVTVSGAEDAPKVEAALRSAALEQSTLHMDVAALEAAAAFDPAVRAVRAVPDFPSGMAVTVDMREPVGYLRSENVVVAGDGVILETAASRPNGIASISAGAEQVRVGSEIGGDALAIARVLGAAPAPLLAQVLSAESTTEYGVTAELGPGIELRFGNGGKADLKWKAAAVVLAEPGVDSVAYLDLSVPDRPVAGGAAERSRPPEPLDSAPTEP